LDLSTPPLIIAEAAQDFADEDEDGEVFEFEREEDKE